MSVEQCQLMLCQQLGLHFVCSALVCVCNMERELESPVVLSDDDKDHDDITKD